ncbi:MAG: NAD(P)H-hydrate dehydratase [Gammaproteobacteria bacterium]|nr:MAG: NAD(P)H-hydrate dehydratase [Gammaproteobacteria bacterium]
MQSIKTAIYQTQQIRELERLAQERFGITEQVMMQRAGKAAFDFLSRRWPNAHSIVVFCGSGNNGGDGYVLAHHAHERGLKVMICQVGDPEKLKEAAKEAFDACCNAQIPMSPFQEKMNLEHPDIIVDAICGTGLQDNLRDEVVAAIKKMQRTRAPIFAIDIPSGIHADTGQVLGAAPHAAATITFIGLKLGLLTGNGIAYTGELVCHDLQLPAELFSYVEPVAEKVTLSSYADYLHPRTRDWHKGLSGHVLIIGGLLGFSGAARMAAEAALRVGAGLVSIATHPGHAAVLNIDRPELMCYGVNTPDELAPLIARANVIVVGPGLGQTEWSSALWAHACKQELPLVVDADGLNLLAKQPQLKENWVLTPHPGEAGRLLNESSPTIQQDRLAVIKAIHQRYGGVVVLKGAGSLILSSHTPPALCDKGNPGMASAGMGDVLSGVIGGLIAQGIPLGDAAKLGVCMHAMAGDLAAKDGERGMIAMDLMPYLRRLANYTSQT